MVSKSMLCTMAGSGQQLAADKLTGRSLAIKIASQAAHGDDGKSPLLGCEGMSVPATQSVTRCSRDFGNLEATL